MLRESDLHYYQNRTIKLGVREDNYMFMLDMGLGKTISVLSILKILLNTCSIRTPLIVAPKFVASDTWPKELAGWSHMRGFTMSLIAGTPKQRIKALLAPADIYVVSRDNIVWLVQHFGCKWPYDMLIGDESSSFKSPSSKRFKAIKHILPKLKRLILLTGTPIPNGLMDIWSQMFLIDRGERLGRFQTSFRAVYFHPYKTLPYGGSLYRINTGADELIYEKIKDRCLSMKAVDYLKLPGQRDIIREVVLDSLDEYEQFKRDKVLELKDGQITAFSASSLYGKLLQYANGAIYDADKNYLVVHDKKLDLLEEVLEEIQGNNVIICYEFKSDLERIKARIPGAVVFKHKDQITDWNNGKIEILLVHPASVAWGLNLQYGGHYLIWYGVTDNAELVWQMITRLNRQGQRFMVMNIMLLVKGTSEYKVHKSILDKTFNQDKLFAALK